MLNPASLENVRAAKAQALEIFSKLADVVGVGITTIGSAYGLKINIKALPKNDVSLPSHVEGIPVKVEVVGSIKKQRPKS